MKTLATPPGAIPLHDYRPALQNAVSWLGERYLLADPVPSRKDDRRPFFNTQRSWYHLAASGNAT